MDDDAIEIFFSFLPEEREFYQQLRRHLSLLERNGSIHCWSHEDLQPGVTKELEIGQHLERVAMIVLLISPAYLASDPHYAELLYALERSRENQTQVVPILLKPGAYQDAPFAGLETLPTGGKTLTTLALSRGKVLSEVATSIRKLLPYNSSSASEIHQPTNKQLHWTVPYPRNPFFTGREADLGTIEAAFSEEQNTTAIRIQAISGLGGIGKTQLALEYAYRHRTHYRYVFWVLADTRETLNAAYSKIAHLLGLPVRQQPEQHIVAEAVKDWMRKHQEWLLILDNADDLGVVRDFLPTSFPGHILLTTRAYAMGRLAERVEIRKLEIEEGSRFLLRRSGLLRKDTPIETLDSATREAAREVVREVDGLPLALDQAGAYIEETNCGLQCYLELYRIQQAEFLSQRGGFVVDHPEPVATTWQLAFERIEASNRGATDLLRLCAFLAPDGIPEAILIKDALELTPSLQKLAENPLLFNAALADLQRYSLIIRHSATHTLDIHRLVQIVLRNAMPEHVARTWAERTVRLMNRIFPWPEMVNWNACRHLLPHAQVCAALITFWQMDLIEGTHLLSCLGEYFYRCGDYHEAQEYSEQVLEINRRILGEEHIDITIVLNNLAAVYLDQGKYAAAETVYRQALAIWHKTLRHEHFDIAAGLNNLGVLYEVQGKYREAEMAYQQSLAVKRKVFGYEHPDTATGLSNLANVYRKQGKYIEAEVAHQQSLAMKCKVLGDEHPDTAASLNNLANVYRVQEKYAEAEALYKRALILYQTMLGDKHPEAATCMSNLGVLYYIQKRYEEALPLLERALAIRQKMLGFKHFHTMIAQRDYEMILQALDNREK